MLTFFEDRTFSFDLSINQEDGQNNFKSIPFEILQVKTQNLNLKQSSYHH